MTTTDPFVAPLDPTGAAFLPRLDAAIALIDGVAPRPVVKRLRNQRDVIAAELAAEVRTVAGVLLRGEPLDGRVVALWPLPAWLSPWIPYSETDPVDVPDVATVREWARARGLDDVAPGLLSFVGPAGAYFTGIASVPGAVTVDGQRWPAAGVWALCRVALDYSPGWAARRAARAVWGLLDERAEERTATVFESAVRAAAGDVALTDREVFTLAGQLRTVARADVLPLFDTLPTSDLEALATVDGALTWDRGLALVLDRIGEIDGARVLLERSAERVAAGTGPALFEGGAAAIFALWTEERDGAPRWLRTLAAALWTHQWAPEREYRATKRGAALPWGVRDHLAAIGTGAPKASDDGSAYLVHGRAEIVARFDAAPPMLDARSRARILAGIEHLRGVTFERVFRGLGLDAFERVAKDGADYGRITSGGRYAVTLRYEGGWEGFASKHGINSKDRADLAAMFDALVAYRGGATDLPPIIAAYWFEGARNTPRYTLCVTLGPVLTPGYGSTFPGTGAARYLLPVLPLPDLSFVGGRMAGRLLDYQWSILQMFRLDPNYARGVPTWKVIDRGQAAELATDVSEKAVRAWMVGGEWLREVSPGRVILSDEGAHGMIVAGVASTRGAAAGGRARAETRASGGPKHTKRR